MTRDMPKSGVFDLEHILNQLTEGRAWSLRGKRRDMIMERRKKKKKERAGSRGSVSGVQLAPVSVSLAAVTAVPLERGTKKPLYIPAD